MNRRQKIWTAASLAVTSGAILGGVAVTSSAMAASSTPAADAPVTVEVISMSDGTGGEAIHCTFTDVSIGSGGFPALPLPDGAVAEAGGVVVSEGVVMSEGAVLPNGGVLPSGAVQAAGGPVLVPLDPTSDGFGSVIGVSGTPATPGAEPVLLTPSDAREGTAEECAALRPTSVPAPPAG